MSIDRTTVLIGDQEWELRVAIPGRILPEEQWSEPVREARLPAGELRVADIAAKDATGPLVLDLGCGNGRFSLLSALARPGMDHVAIDSDSMHLRYLRRRLRQRGISNVRLHIGDAADLLARLTPEAACEIHVYHPQPWHEEGLAHRRLFHPSFQLHAHRVLAAEGMLCVQTDSLPYSHYLRGTLPFLFQVRELAASEAWPDGLGQPRGRRELVATTEGLTLFRYHCIKQPLAPEEAARRTAALPLPSFQSDRKASPHRKAKAARGQRIRG